MSVRQLILASLLLSLPLGLQAQERSPGAGEPDVIIRDEGDKKIEEYRINGILYSIKVTPKDGGTPYYLVRSQDDGNFIRADKPEMHVPSWKIFTW